MTMLDRVQGQQTGFIMFNINLRAIVKGHCIVNKQDDCLGGLCKCVFRFGVYPKQKFGNRAVGKKLEASVYHMTFNGELASY